MGQFPERLITFALLSVCFALCFPFVQAFARVTGMSWWAKLSMLTGLTFSLFFLIALSIHVFAAIEQMRDRR